MHNDQMENKGGFVNLIFILLIPLILISALLFIFVFKSTNKKNFVATPLVIPSTTDTLLKPTVNYEWNIPNLPVGFDWQTKSLNKEEAVNYRMLWDSTGSENSYGDIPFSATLYTTDLNYDDRKDILDYRDFVDKFGKEMNSKGWSFDVLYGNKRIMGMAADGVFSSIYGTVKINDSQIRSVGYSYNLNSTSWEGPGSDIVCPCQLHLEIFIGDEVNLKDI